MSSNEELQKPETALVKSAEPQLETVKNVNAGKDMTIARHNGRFVKKATILAAETAKRIAKVAFTPDETGQTQVDKVIASQLRVAEENSDPRNLNSVAGLLDTIDKLSGQEMIRSKMAKETEKQNPIAVVFVNATEGSMMHKEVIDYDAKVKADAEKMKNGPSFLKIQSLYTNPPAQDRKE